MGSDIMSYKVDKLAAVPHRKRDARNRRRFWRTRSATDDDSCFIFELFCDVRKFEFQSFNQGMVHELLAMQFRAQKAAYESAYPEAVCVILESFEGESLGRLLYYEREADLHIVDLALLERHRRNGIGSQVLSMLQRIAVRKALPVTLSVARQNPAIGLYRRLGFTENGGDEVYCTMMWSGNSNRMDGDQING